MTKPPSLSGEVASRTKAAHDRTESRPFMSELMAGALSVRSYVAYLAALAPVYEELEHQLRSTKGEASISLFDHRRLDRHDRICSDLRGFGQHVDKITPSPVTRAYVDVIRSAAVSPQRLIAHHYTRYLGDLAGGQVIARCMSQHYDVPETLLSFYDFSDLGDVVHYRRRYKSLLDLVPWSAGEKREFIDEVSKVFDLNASLFDELASEKSAPESNPGAFLRAERVHLPR